MQQPTTKQKVSSFTHSLSTKEWLIESNRLRQRSALLHREILHFAQQFSEKFQSEETQRGEIDLSEELQAEEAYSAEKTELFSKIKRISTAIKRFHAQITLINKKSLELADFRGNNPNISLSNNLQAELEAVEDILSEFKLSARENYLKLSISEAQVSSELHLLQQKFNNFDEKSHTGEEEVPQRAFSQPIAAIHTEYPSNLEEDFELELRNIDKLILLGGGATLGWNSEDHAHFLRLFSQYLNQKVLLSRLQSELSQFSPAELLQHIDNQRKFDGLLAQKKKILASWKENREKMQQKVLEKEKNGEAAQLNPAISSKIGKEQRETQLKLIEAWKMSKIQQKEEEERQKLEQREALERAERVKLAETRAKAKISLDVYHKTKEMALVEQKSQDLAQKQYEKAVKEQEQGEIEARLAQRNADFFAKQAEIKEKAAMEAELLQEKRKILLEQAQTKVFSEIGAVESNSQRLIGLNQAQKARNREILAEKERVLAAKAGGKAANLQLAAVSNSRLAVPSWRK
jgi:hypothetical protein